MQPRMSVRRSVPTNSRSAGSRTSMQQAHGQSASTAKRQGVFTSWLVMVIVEFQAIGCLPKTSARQKGRSVRAERTALDAPWLRQLHFFFLSRRHRLSLLHGFLPVSAGNSNGFSYCEATYYGCPIECTADQKICYPVSYTPEGDYAAWQA